MLKVIGKKIYLTRGDTAYIKVNIRTPDGQPYTFTKGDEVWFAVKRKTTDNDYLIAPKILEPQIVEGTENDRYPTYEVYLHISPEETDSLPFGTFVYDLSLVNNRKNYVSTIIEPSPFVVLEEVGSSRRRGGGWYA